MQLRRIADADILAFDWIKTWHSLPRKHAFIGSCSPAEHAASFGRVGLRSGSDLSLVNRNLISLYSHTLLCLIFHVTFIFEYQKTHFPPD